MNNELEYIQKNYFPDITYDYLHKLILNYIYSEAPKYEDIVIEIFHPIYTKNEKTSFRLGIRYKYISDKFPSDNPIKHDYIRIPLSELIKYYTFVQRKNKLDFLKNKIDGQKLIVNS